MYLSTAAQPGGFAATLGSNKNGANALDRLVAAETIREIDRKHVTFIVRKIVHPPERPDDPLAENAG
jgi:hypothetical protein